MPSVKDISGQRFGKLVVLNIASRGPVRWLCRCDCGAETVVLTERLSSVDDANRRAIRACEKCRSRTCSVCGSLYLSAGNGSTCGRPECRLAIQKERAVRIRDIQAAFRQRKRLQMTEDELAFLREKRRDDYRQKMASLTDDEIGALRAQRHEQYCRKVLGMTDRERDAFRARRREHYRATREDRLAWTEQWLDSMTPERRAEIEARARQNKIFRAREKSLGGLMSLGARLQEMIDGDDSDD